MNRVGANVMTLSDPLVSCARLLKKESGETVENIGAAGMLVVPMKLLALF